mmetsp:Transcript_16877/g.68090  ORF Transcript_16877/g.68090 Transcript_16877/m.68090 type:complete len:108 (+) Transcript_16877:615-938(+)
MTTTPPRPAAAAVSPHAAATTTTTTTSSGGGDAPPDTTSAAAPRHYPIYPYEALRAPGPFPDDVRVGEREMHLSDEEFVRVIGVTKDVFAQQPKWKKDAKKRASQLF